MKLRPLNWLLRMVLVILLLFFLFLPLAFFYRFEAGFIRSALESVVESRTGLRAEVGKIEFRPGFPPVLYVYDFILMTDGEREVVEVPVAELQLSWSYLFQGVIRPEKVLLREPVFTIDATRRNTWSWLFATNSRKRVRPPGQPKLKGWFRGPEAWRMPFLTFVIEGGHLDFKGADMVSLKAGVHAVMDVDIANNRRRFDAELADAAGETEWVVQSIYEGREHDLHLKLSDTGQRLMFEGFIRGIGREKTLTEGVLDFTGVAAADFWQRLYPDVKSPFSGALTLEARLRFEGIPFLDPGRKFTAQGVLDARQGEWQAVDLPGSLLKETAGTVAWELPEESLLSGFPGPASGAFERLEGDFEASESRLRWGRLFLKQEHYVVEMQGVLDVGGGETDMTGKLVMLEDLAREVVAREKRFAVFMNRAGRLVLPFHYSGLYPGGVVAPDKDYVRAAAATLIPEPERAEPVNLRDIPDFSETPQEPESLPRAASASPETVAREPVPAGKPAAPAAAEKTRPGPQESGESDEDIDWFKVLEEM